MGLMRNDLASRISAVAIMAMIVSTVLTVMPVPARAQSLALYTEFIGISVERGETLSLPITISNLGGSGKNVDLSIASAPTGWKVVLKGRDMLVHKVYVPKGDDQIVYLEAKVPDEIETGVYSIVVKGTSGAESISLPIEIKVEETASTIAELITQYPVLRGPAKAKFVFRLDLRNNGVKEQSFSLAAAAPAGWNVGFKPSYEDKQITTLSLKGGATQGLDLEVIPPPKVKAGEYPLAAQVTGIGKPIRTDLKVVITGSYELDLTTSSERLNINASAGKENGITLLIRNTGTADLNGVTLYSNEPTGWSVRFDPDKVDVIPAGTEQQVTAFIKPSNRAIAGDYVVSIGADTQEAGATQDFRVSVRTPTTWGIIGIVIVLLVVVGVGMAFKTYGRR